MSEEIPQEIRDKMDEIRNTAIALKNEFANTPKNSEKILELHAKHFLLIQELSEWCLKQKLEMIEAESAENKPVKDKAVKNKPAKSE